MILGKSLVVDRLVFERFEIPLPAPVSIPADSGASPKAENTPDLDSGPEYKTPYNKANPQSSLARYVTTKELFAYYG